MVSFFAAITLPISYLLLLEHVVSAQKPASPAPLNPIRKVLTLIEEMKAQVEQEAGSDLEAYDKYMCWSDTNEKEKTAAIKNAEDQLKELSAFVEQAAAKKGELKTEIATLDGDIANDMEAIQTAAAVRENEKADALKDITSLKESRGVMDKAGDTLKDATLVQRSQESQSMGSSAMLLQVSENTEHTPKFHEVMQADLFDVLGSFQQASRAFLPRRSSAALAQSQQQPPGDAPNYKYNSQSSAITGTLKSMEEEFTKDLSKAQKEEFQAEVQFQKMRAAKLGEVEATKEQKKQKETELADLLDKAAKAKDDIVALQEAQAADEDFLSNLRDSRAAEDKQYSERTKTRNEEIRALAETLKILTADESKQLFDKTMSFMQISNAKGSSENEIGLRAEDRLAERAMERIASYAKQHKNWEMASLAVQVQMDDFKKVKEVMDKMLTELTKQQKEEVEKKDVCTQQVDEAEDDIKEAKDTKDDLDEKHLDLTNTISTIKTNMDELMKEISDMEVNLKKAGEDRKQQNLLFKQSISDQRATAMILNKAMARLKMFYGESTFVQVHAHGSMSKSKASAVQAPPPPSSQSYEKSAESGNVLGLISRIIKDAETTQTELMADEQEAQEAYVTLVKDTTRSIDADRSAIEQKQEKLAKAQSEKSETEEAQLSNNQELTKLTDLLKAHHLDCDFLLKYFDLRQKARADEIDAIQEAKAILSGADFKK